MHFTQAKLPAEKGIALVAHDHQKPHLIEWCQQHQTELQQHALYATGTTGQVISAATGLKLTSLISGPLGGDQQIGALITEGKVNVLIFFWDPFEPMPHDPDVKALLRIAAAWNIPVACNQASADVMMASPLMQTAFDHRVPDYPRYLAERT